VSFRREAHVARGGPDGGDGGRGGDVVVVCDASLRDLRTLRRRTHYRAGAGVPGSGALRHGANGEALTLAVPPGTLLTGSGGEIEGRAWDLVLDGQQAVVARGGAGGRGNKRFASPKRQAPHFAERGLPGEDGELELALKLLADVGLVGLPNAGKSSLLASLTRATPKVAAYPFTTLEPNLGVLSGEDGQLVLADIPGLIEGASAGAGLGDEFLAHIERTSLLVHVIDVAPELTGGDGASGQLASNYELIERELELHDRRLARLPRVIALSKADLVDSERAQRAAAELSGRVGPEVPVLITSSATGMGLAQLAAELLARVPAPGAGAGSGSPHAGQAAEGAGADRYRAGSASGEDGPMLAKHMVFRPGISAGYEVRALSAGVFSLSGPSVERLIERFDLENPEAVAYIEARMRRLGVFGALRSAGFAPGDVVRVGESALALFASASA
jgi:GTP-binding protein